MNHPTLRSFCLSIISLLISSSIFGQALQVNTTLPGFITAEDILTQVFVNQGIDIVSVTYEGDEIAVGEFTNGLAHVGIDEGIVLSTGVASTQNVNGPLGADGVGSGFASADNDSNFLSPNLSNIAVTSTINDVGRFVIEFAASSDSVRFQYVFASEEYPEYACTNFNDVMGIFISGPGINGAFENNGINIALVPDTDVPVSINNIHPENGPACPPAFEAFYNDNNGTTNQPVYDGFLDVFYSVAQVIPGEIYTLEIAIADGGDNVFDSAFFLAAESFGSDSLVVNTTVDVVSSIAETGGMVEIPFNFSGTKAPLFPITYEMTGTAVYGVDYQSSMPATGVINSADELLNFAITPMDDGSAEAYEYLKIRFDAPAVAFDEYVVYFLDEVSCDLPAAMTLCEAAPIELSVTSAEQDSIFYFENTDDLPITGVNEPVFSDIAVTNVPFEKLYTLDIIESICINVEHKFLADLDIYLRAPDGSYLELTTDNGSDCDNYENTCFNPRIVEVIPSLVGYDCAANEVANYTGTFNAEGNWRRLLDTPINGTWSLVCIDDVQGFSGTLLDWSISFKTEALQNFPVLWSNGATSSSISVLPTETTTYQVSAGPNCNAEVTVEVLADFSINNFEICENESIEIDGITLDIDNPSVDFIYQNQAGCDSVIAYNLSFSPVYSTLIEATILEGETYELGGVVFNETGIYETTYLTQNGCDSLVVLDLSVMVPPFVLLEDDEVTSSSCDLFEYCLPLSAMMLNNLSAIELNGEIYTDLIQDCPDDSGSVLLPLGVNELILTDENGYADTTQITVIPAAQTLEEVHLAGVFEIIYDLNTPICGNEIISVNNLCPDLAQESTLTVSSDLTTLVFTGQDEPMEPLDSFCLEICDDLGYCFYQTFTVSITAVGTQEIISNQLFEVYPSPTNEFFKVKSTTNSTINTLHLFAVNGQKINTWIAPTINQSFDIERLNAGVYYLKIETMEGVVIKKVVKQ